MDLLAQETKEMMTVLFDGSLDTCASLLRAFNSFLYRSNEGKAMTNTTDAPFLVDSKITSGIQIADMAAGAIRLYEENRLFQGLPSASPFLSAIKRYYSILEEKTKEQETQDGFILHGFYRMPERDHYISDDMFYQRSMESTITKPENQP
jgi:hypothetical protein